MEHKISYQTVPGSPGCIALIRHGDFLYAAGNDLFAVYDIRRPMEPKLLRKRAGFGCGRQFAISGKRLYLTAREFGLWIFDLSRPENPKLLTRYDTVELATGIAAAGDLVFVEQRIYGVEILDCSDPRHPRHLSLTRTQEAQSAAYSEGKLYIGNWAGANVQVLDVRDPRNPVTVAGGDLGGFGDGIALSEGICFAATGLNARGSSDNALGGDGHGLDLFRIEGNSLRHLSRIAFPRLLVKSNDFWSVRISGRTAFVADTHNGVFRVDVTDPSHPKITGCIVLPEIARIDVRPEGQVSIRVPDCAGSIALGNGVLYIAGEKTGLHTAEIRDLHPRESTETGLRAPRTIPSPDPEIPGVRQYRFDGQLRRIALDGETLYAACSHAGLRILRLEGDELRETTALPMACSYDIAVRNGLLYSAEGLDGLAIYSLKDGLREIGRWKRRGVILQLLHLSDNGRFAVCGGRGGVLRFLDITDPAAPRLAFRHLHGGQLYGDTFPEHELNHLMPMIWPYCGIAWYDLSRRKPVQVLDDRKHLTGQTQGITPMQGRFLMNTQDNRFLFLHPEEPEKVIVSPSEGCNGVPSACGDLAAFSDRRNGCVHLYRFHADLAEPVPERTISGLRGMPDRVRFHKGRMLIPCGWQGLLIETDERIR